MVPDTAGYIVLGIAIFCFLVVLFFFKIILESKNRTNIVQEYTATTDQHQPISSSTISNPPEVSALRLFIFLLIEIALYAACMNVPMMFKASYVNDYFFIGIVVIVYTIFITTTFFVSKYFLFSKLSFRLWPKKYKTIFFITISLPLLSVFM